MKIAAIFSLAFLAPLAAGAQTIKLDNPGFEQAPRPGDTIPGWRAHQHAGDPSYEFVLDNKVFAKGKNAFRITRLLEQDYGALDQTLPGRDLIGKEIEFSALVKAKDVSKRGFVLCINIIDAGGDVREQLRSNPRTVGTVDTWTRLTARAKVPSGTRSVEIGFLLIGGGTVWVDEASLKIVAPPADNAGDKTKVAETTRTSAKPAYPEKPAKAAKPEKKTREAAKAGDAKNAD